jgi:hypothetical protein
VEDWSLKRIEQHPVRAPIPEDPAVSESLKAKEIRRVSEFSTRKRNDATGQAFEPVDDWKLFNSDSDSADDDGEGSILQYWKCMHLTKRLPASGCVAKDVLGLPSSATSVERLFSQSRFVYAKNRASMAPAMLARHTSLKVWHRKGCGLDV